MRKKLKTLSVFLSGALCAVLVISLAVPSVAAGIQKTINVMTGINIYINDIKLNPTDVNGNPVDVLLYNGTTYLPVRAVSQAFGKNIEWDGSTQSVFVGEHAANQRPALPLYELDYFTSSDFSRVIHGTAQDNLGVNHDSMRFQSDTMPLFNSYDMSITYLLNGKYSALTGKYFLLFEDRSTQYDSSCSIYGDGRLLWTGTIVGGVAPLDFNVDLRGVNELVLKFYNPHSYGRSSAYLGDVMLYT